MADILLSFGASKTSSDVGKMRDDLDSIIKQIEKKPPKVRVGLTVDNDALNHFKKELQAILNTVSLANGAPITLNISGLGEISAQATKAADAMKKVSGAVKQQDAAMSTVLRKYEQAHALLRKNANANDTTSESYKRLAAQVQFFEDMLEKARRESISIGEAFTRSGADITTAVNNMTTSMSAFRAEMEHTGHAGSVSLRQIYELTAQMKNTLHANGESSSSAEYGALNSQLQSLDAVLDAVAQDGMSVEQAFQKVYGAGVNVAQTFDGAKTSLSAFRKIVAGTKDDTEEFQKQMRILDTLIKQVDKSLENWTRAKNGKSRGAYLELQKESEALHQMRTNLASTGKALKGFNQEVERHASAVGRSSTVIKDAAEDTKSLGDKWLNLGTKFGSWLTVSQSIMAALRTVKKMVATVVELDSAMTELKKVTDEADATYERFLTNASVRAKNLGVSLSDTVRATSEFARLGHDIGTASKLADIALMYKNIGDGVENVTQATESIVSTMQAFGVLPGQAEHIVDVFNIIGNKFAISSGGIGDALQRSAAAMNAAGNTLEQTAALVAAANTVVQNPESVGTTLKTVSMFLRASKVEAEAAGESTEGMANSVSELREQLLALTEGRVDILTDSGQYKSTYEILKDISAVWKDIVKNQGTDSAAILELVGGKRNANVVAAILENFTIAEDALAVAINSAGSAAEENAKHLDAITGRIGQFKAAWESLSSTVINSTFVKHIVSAGTALLGAIEGVSKHVGLLEVSLVTIPKLFSAYANGGNFTKTIDGIKDSVMSFAGGAKRCSFEYARYTVVVTRNEPRMR